MEHTLQEELIHQLHQNFHLMQENHSKALKKVEKNYNKPHVLEALYESNAEISQDDLAKRFAAFGEDFGKTLRKLQAKGYVTISGNGKGYYITFDGRRKIQQIRKREEELIGRLLHGLSETEQRSLRGIMEKINANLRTQAVYGGYNYYLEDCWEPYGCVKPPEDLDQRY